MNTHLKHSALLPLHRSAGATLGEHHGWLLPHRFQDLQLELAGVRDAVGLADTSYRAKYLTTADPGVPAWRLTDRRFLLIGDPPLKAPPRAVEVTSVYAELLLAGPYAEAVLAKLGPVDLSASVFPDGSVTECELGHVHCIALRSDLPPTTCYRLLVTRDYAESLWEAVEHAGEEYGLRLFGQKALAVLMES